MVKYLDKKLEELIAIELPNWKIVNGKLRLELKTKNWSESINIANMVSFFSEKYNHHPDLTIHYSSVVIEYSTHDTGSITTKDTSIALLIDDALKITKFD